MGWDGMLTASLGTGPGRGGAVGAGCTAVALRPDPRARCVFPKWLRITQSESEELLRALSSHYRIKFPGS